MKRVLIVNYKYPIKVYLLVVDSTSVLAISGSLTTIYLYFVATTYGYYHVILAI